MKNRLLTLVLIVLAAVSAAAQKTAPSDASDAKRDKYITEIRRYKHDRIARELDLSKEQQREFFPLYDEMEDQMMKLNNETRDLERKTEANADASDAELEAAAIAIYSQRLKEGQIEMAFYEKFSKILNNRQILRLKNTERKFTQRLMKHHRDARKESPAKEATQKRQK